MNNEIEYLSKEKYDQLQAELEELRTIKRKEIAAELDAARSLGDLSENAEYHAAREEQAKIEDRISHLKFALQNAQIITKHSTKEVSLGSVVTLKRKDTKEEKVYILVGSEEADILQNKISYQSPLGTAMTGRKKGEEFDFSTPKGKTSYKVIDIK